MCPGTSLAQQEILSHGSRASLGDGSPGCNMSHGDHEEQTMKLQNLAKAYELRPEAFPLDLPGEANLDTENPELSSANGTVSQGTSETQELIRDQLALPLARINHNRALSYWFKWCSSWQELVRTRSHQ
eukprot:Skav217526  [mRNA]  locus=scaffold4186:77259:77645:+ [translate_table: standard]